MFPFRNPVKEALQRPSVNRKISSKEFFDEVWGAGNRLAPLLAAIWLACGFAAAA
jgi:hypothetical protein